MGKDFLCGISMVAFDNPNKTFEQQYILKNLIRQCLNLKAPTFKTSDMNVKCPPPHPHN